MNRDQIENVFDLRAIELAIFKKFDELSATSRRDHAEIAQRCNVD